MFYGTNTSMERKRSPKETKNSIYNNKKNNDYLQGKLKVISNRRTPCLTIDPFSLIEKQQKCNNTIRSMHLKKIQQENLLFK